MYRDTWHKCYYAEGKHPRGVQRQGAVDEVPICVIGGLGGLENAVVEEDGAIAHHRHAIIVGYVTAVDDLETFANVGQGDGDDVVAQADARPFFDDEFEGGDEGLDVVEPEDVSFGQSCSFNPYVSVILVE